MIAHISLICKRDTQSDDWQHRLASWDCRLGYQGRQLRVQHLEPYDNGIPTTTSVINSLFQIADDSRSPVEAWFDRLGKSPDTRKKYENAVRVAAALHEFLRPNYRQIYTERNFSNDYLTETSNPVSAAADIEKEIDFCHQQGLLVDTCLRRHHTNEPVLEAAREWDAAISTAHLAWIAARMDVKRGRDPSSSIAKAVKHHNRMLNRRENYRSVLSEQG